MHLLEQCTARLGAVGMVPESIQMVFVWEWCLRKIPICNKAVKFQNPAAQLFLLVEGKYWALLGCSLQCLVLKINFSSSEQSLDCCTLCASASVLPGKSFINVLLKTCVCLLFFLFVIGSAHWEQLSSLPSQQPPNHTCALQIPTADNCTCVCVRWGLWAWRI